MAMKGKNLSDILFIAGVMLASIHAYAQPDPQKKCALITDDTARLACYDNLAQPTVATLAPKVIDAPASDVQEDIDNVVATVKTASHSPSTGWTLTFDNGQSWKQIGTASFVVNTADTCTITPGMTNSFLLQCGNRVRRIQVAPVE